MFGHRVFAARAQWLTAQHTPAGQQAATPRAEADERNPCIIGATGVKATTLSQQGAEPALVAAKQKKQESGHDKFTVPEQLVALGCASIPEAGLLVWDTWAITPGRHGQNTVKGYGENDA